MVRSYKLWSRASSRPELTPFSYVILMLVGRSGAGPHDLRGMMMRGGRFFWSAGESQYYSEPKRLVGLGYLTAEKTPGKTRERTHYMLTDAALDALREWVATPAAFPRIQNELVVKVQCIDLVGGDAILEGLPGFRADLDALSALTAANEGSAEALPHRERMLKLNQRYARRLVELHREWALEIEKELRNEGK
jgi:PadR family transcriptional regulator, regulatory protein AphA